MLKRLLQNLGLVEKPKRRRPTSRIAPGGSKHKRCRNCTAILPQAAFRCAACGARVLQEQEQPATKSTSQLGDLELRILTSAAAEIEERIVTLKPSGSTAGEVKAGPDRYEGSEALQAIRLLLRNGYIAEWGDGSYAITPEGQKFVENSG